MLAIADDDLFLLYTANDGQTRHSSTSKKCQEILAGIGESSIRYSILSVFTDFVGIL